MFIQDLFQSFKESFKSFIKIFKKEDLFFTILILFFVWFSLGITGIITLFVIGFILCVAEGISIFHKKRKQREDKKRCIAEYGKEF